VSAEAKKTMVHALDRAVTWLDDASAAAKAAGLTDEHDQIEAVWSDAQRLLEKLNATHGDLS
jgi:hypothetical protein